jgi:hypothetical protein
MMKSILKQIIRKHKMKYFNLLIKIHKKPLMKKNIINKIILIYPIKIKLNK